MSEEQLMVFKKPSYPLNESFLDYLERFDRVSKVSIFYDDLLRFSGAISVFDSNDVDTLWFRVYYSESERNEIDLNLKKIYSFLGVEFTSIDTTNLKQFSINEIEYNDVLIEGIPHQGLHTIRTNEIKKRSYTIEEYLPNEVIKKYKNSDIIKQ